LNRLLAAEGLHSATCPRQEADWIARGKALNTLSYLTLRAGFTDRTQYRARVLESKAIFQKLINELGDAFQCDFAISIFLLADTEKDFLVCRQLFQTVQDPLYLAECDQDLAVLCMRKSNLDAAYDYNEENLELRKEMGDLDGKAYALFLAASIALCRGKHSMAIELAKRSLNTFETVGNRAIIGFPLATLRIVEMVQGDYQQAIEQSEMERALGQDLSSPYLLKDALSYEGYVAWARKEYEQAVRLAQKALEIANDLPSVWKKMPLYLLGRVALSRGDYPQAREYLVESITNTLHWDIFEYDYHAIQALGVMAAAQGQERRAALMFGAQEALCSWLLNIICPAERDEYEQALAATRAILGKKVFAAAWEEGRSMTEEQLRQYVAELPLENPVVKYMQKNIDSQ
jgi:tetratricopeptide (TPR) repeat protein